MRIKRSLAILSSVIIAGSILAGCGRPLHHATKTASHDATERTTHKASWKKRPTHNVSAKDEFNHSHHNAHGIKSQDKNNNSSANNSMNKSNENTPRANIQSSSTDNVLPTVNLGHGVTGQVDRGAGQVYVTFDYNGQHFMSHGNDINESANTAVNNARGIVNRLSNN